MSVRTVLTIGFIPVDCASEFIMIGDPDMSGTKEVDFEIAGAQITGIGNGFSLDTTGADWFDVTSPIFAGLAAAATEAAKTAGVTNTDLAAAAGAAAQLDSGPPT